MDTFLSAFSWHIEINNLSHIVSLSSISEKSENIFFLGGIREWLLQRASDNDIISKNYFVIDLDIRSEYLKSMLVPCTTEYIIHTAYAIIWLLRKHKYFSEWRFILFSGNGLHIYYIWDTLTVPNQITKETYSAWVETIYREFQEYVRCEWIKPDYNCRNISRIMRLPGTINKKNGLLCRVLYSQPISSRLVNELFIRGAKSIEKQLSIDNEKEIIYKKEQKERIKKSWDQENIYEMINKEFPAYHFAEEINGFKLAPNWRNFINEKGWYCWYWYNKEKNIILNGGSSHYFLNHNGYNPYMIVKEYHNFTDKQTFEFFKNLISTSIIWKPVK